MLVGGVTLPLRQRSHSDIGLAVGLAVGLAFVFVFGLGLDVRLKLIAVKHLSVNPHHGKVFRNQRLWWG